MWLRELHQVHIRSEALHSKWNFPCHWGFATRALRHMRSPANRNRRRSIYAAPHRRCHDAYGWVHIEVHVGCPSEIRRMEGSYRNEVGKHVKRFRTDGGGEYTSKAFAEYLKSEGILKETTTPYTPQANGVIERVNCMIIQCLWCMLGDAGPSKMYRVFAVSVAVYLKHRTPMWSVVGTSIYEVWHQSKWFLKQIHVFRFLAFIQVSKEKWKKLDYRATPGIFGGYSISTKQYLIYYPLAKTLHRCRDVVFSEGKRYTAPNAADEAILNEHFYRDVSKEPKPIEKQPTERQTEMSLDDNSPPVHPKPNKKSREFAGLGL